MKSGWLGMVVVASLSLSACGGGDGGGPTIVPPPGGGGGSGMHGQLGLSTTALSINESAGTATIMVNRVGGSSGAVSIQVGTGEVIAKAGADFTSLFTTVSFADGDSTAKPLTLSITNDTVAEGDESFIIAVLNPSGGAEILRTAEVAVVTIVDDDKPVAANLSIGYEIKRLAFAWTAAANATSYKLLQRVSGAADFAQVGEELPSTATRTRIAIPVHLYKWAAGAPEYRLDACNSGFCTPSNSVTTARVGSALAAAYIKASNTSEGARFGGAVASSGDGRTVAIGAPFESGEAGSVYVYTAPNAPNPALFPIPVRIQAPSAQAMHFGFSVALSEDGNTLVVGAPYDSHLQTGVGTYPTTPNENAVHSGGVFIYTRAGGMWSATPAYIKAVDADAADEFGSALAMKSGFLVVGAPRQNGPTDGIDPTNPAPDSGAAYVFYQNAGTWTAAPRILKSANIGNGALFGSAVAISDAGAVIAVGSPAEDDGGKLDAGAAYRFVKADGAGAPSWNAPTRFQAVSTSAGALFGQSVAVSANGGVLAVGAPNESGDEGNETGAVYVHTVAQNAETDTARLQALHRFSGAHYGSSVAISADGNILAVGSPTESVNQIGVDGDLNSPGTAPSSGAVDVLLRQGNAVWSAQGDDAPKQHYIKANVAGPGDLFGGAVSLSADGQTLVVGASGEDGNGANISGNNNPGDNSVSDSGAVYFY